MQQAELECSQNRPIIFRSILRVRPIHIGRLEFDDSPDYSPKNHSSITASTSRLPKQPCSSRLLRASISSSRRRILTACLDEIKSFSSQEMFLYFIIVPSAFVSRIIGLARVRFVSNKIIVQRPFGESLARSSFDEVVAQQRPDIDPNQGCKDKALR